MKEQYLISKELVLYFRQETALRLQSSMTIETPRWEQMHPESRDKMYLSLVHGWWREVATLEDMLKIISGAMLVSATRVVVLLMLHRRRKAWPVWAQEAIQCLIDRWVFKKNVRLWIDVKDREKDPALSALLTTLNAETPLPLSSWLPFVGDASDDFRDSLALLIPRPTRPCTALRSLQEHWEEAVGAEA